MSSSFLFEHQAEAAPTAAPAAAAGGRHDAPAHGPDERPHEPQHERRHGRPGHRQSAAAAGRRPAGWTQRRHERRRKAGHCAKPRGACRCEKGKNFQVFLVFCHLSFASPGLILYMYRRSEPRFRASLLLHVRTYMYITASFPLRPPFVLSYLRSQLCQSRNNIKGLLNFYSFFFCTC